MQQYEIDQRIWAYIDGLDTATEKQKTEMLLATDRAWKETYERLLAMQSLLSDKNLLDEPSMRFTQNIMEQLATVQPAHKMQPLAKSWVVKLLGAFFVLSTILWGVLLFTTKGTGNTQIFHWEFSSKENHNLLFFGAAIYIVVLLVLADRYRSFRKQIHKTNPSA
ncbi:anti-sigma factor family protein [Taibaiella soli]|uniref:Uncharacterized protein n=1 Tax=Taibaiella soli TaxID=1649169 RepID=A0A2W2BFH6_9BACT|nr:hypothetical protein [Taibaiella soli]PZF74627.1 hypothetical protein DN068_03355 [Taibaiella soli]